MSEVEQTPTSHRHFSSRLGRYWQAGDVLYLDEVAEVLSENSGRPIATKYITALIVKGMLAADGPPRNRYVQYTDVQYRRVYNQPGKHKHNDPSPNALRQRAFKARRAISTNRNDK
ncbi:MAG: hypothetical protein ACJ8BW_21985 [Ktedonobacteraceae bacterium]|jgi:hypothetical protein